MKWKITSILLLSRINYTKFSFSITEGLENNRMLQKFKIHHLIINQKNKIHSVNTEISKNIRKLKRAVSLTFSN